MKYKAFFILSGALAVLAVYNIYKVSKQFNDIDWDNITL
jgi:hypothetical protein